MYFNVANYIIFETTGMIYFIVLESMVTFAM